MTLKNHCFQILGTHNGAHSGSSACAAFLRDNRGELYEVLSRWTDGDYACAAFIKGFEFSLRVE